MRCREGKLKKKKKTWSRGRGKKKEKWRCWVSKLKWSL